MELIPVTAESHDVVIDIKYATSDNFTGQPVYCRPGCYLHGEAEALFRRAIELARIQGWRFIVFDCFRPSEAQFKLWDHTPDPDFLADPNRGSPHSRGVAIDLNLIDATTGEALDMGTAFDAFTPLSHHGNTDISSAAQKNRYRLLGLMTAAGWDCYLKEWWHYQLFDSRSYDVLSDNVLDQPMMG
ncbi:MAG: D-alanyl-D-alanine dipeptidase [Rhodospirillales bacterium]|nr:D-alanyl-D-alanine dipeptidase [Rhodospirillales bacterium]